MNSNKVTIASREFRIFVNQFGEAWLDQRDEKYVKSVVEPYMKSVVEDHVDWKTNEVNSTHLAEDAAQHFDLYATDATCAIPAQLYDWSAEVGIQWEDAHQDEN